MEESYIESLNNSHVKNLVKLRERKHRNRQERFIIEGYREIKHSIEANFQIETLYFCPELFPSEVHVEYISNIKTQRDIPLIRMHPSAFKKASLREGPDGIIAVSKPNHYSLNQLKTNKASIILVLECIEKPGNLGAIIRSAEGAGVDALFMIDCAIDCYNPNAIRSSQGLVFRIPIIDLKHDVAFQWLSDSGYQVIATSPNAKVHYNEQDYSSKNALVMGSESDGLTPLTLSRVNQTVQIPMYGKADSLNVSVATAICLYEIKNKIIN